jgi:hypothetical protein
MSLVLFADMPPNKHVKPIRADGLQKLLLYLILLNFWLLYLYVAHFVRLPLTLALLVSLLCIGYNLLLCHLAVHRPVAAPTATSSIRC